MASSSGSASIRDIEYGYGVDTVLRLNRKIVLESIRPAPLKSLFYR
jgi:hypothetical protein